MLLNFPTEFVYELVILDLVFLPTKSEREKTHQKLCVLFSHLPFFVFEWLTFPFAQLECLDCWCVGVHYQLLDAGEKVENSYQQLKFALHAIKRDT